MSDGLLWTGESGEPHFRMLDDISADALPDEATQYAVAHRSHQLVLRGAAVDIGDGTIVLAGAAGSGASTIAAAAVRNGAQLVADGALGIDVDNEKAHVARRNAPIALWADVLPLLDLTGLEPVADGVAKYRWNVPIVDSQLLPIDGIVVVDPTLTHPGIGALRGAAAAAALGRARALVAVEPRRSMEAIVETIGVVPRLGAVHPRATSPHEVVDQCRRWLSDTTRS